MDNTANYRRHGALLSIDPVGAAFLAGRGLASPDPLGDGDGLVGMVVPGDKIDRHIQGGDPALRLVGGVMVARGEERDAVIGVWQTDIDGLFDEEEKA